MKFIRNIKNNHKLRLEFNRLAEMVFGINFEPWYEQGFWNDRYQTYSLIHEGLMVSNVSVNRMDLVINGKLHQALQLGTVMTHPDYRRQGLSAELMEKVINEWKDQSEIIYLFANVSVYDYYPKFGFKERSEVAIVSYNVNYDNVCTIRKLDLVQDFSLIQNLVYHHRPTSQQPGVVNDSHLLLFYLLNVYKDSIYYLPEMNAAAIYSIENGELHLYGILATDKIDTEHVLQQICDTTVHAIHYYFIPHPMNDSMEMKPYASDYKLFVHGQCDLLPEKIRFPLLSHA